MLFFSSHAIRGVEKIRKICISTYDRALDIWGIWLFDCEKCQTIWHRFSFFMGCNVCGCKLYSCWSSRRSRFVKIFDFYSLLMVTFLGHSVCVVDRTIQRLFLSENGRLARSSILLRIHPNLAFLSNIEPWYPMGSLFFDCSSLAMGTHL